MTGNNGFRAPDPFERSYGGTAPWEDDHCTGCGGNGACPECAGIGARCECDGEGIV